MADETKEKVYKYKVRPGFRHGAFDQYKAGDVVELTEAAALPLLDKLEPVSDKLEDEQQAVVRPELVTTEDKGKKGE